MTNTWLIEVEFEDGEVFTHRTHKNPHDAGWECVFPTAVAVRFSPVPAQESQGASIPAPAEVGQGQGTITVQELQRWLDKKAAAARQAIKEGCDFSDRKCVHEPAIDYCRIASALIREFIQEQGA